ncbi:MAG: DNA alkylation repair protein [Flavobacterium sp.]|nr:MAG: DNA alkylation repair protein [Flavobacterium sp.]
MLQIPDAPNSIQKGFPLKMILDQKAISQLSKNLHFVYPEFDATSFVKDAMNSIEELSITERSKHIAKSMNNYLPNNYSEAVPIILNSLTPPLEKTEGNGLAVLFYMPHCSFIANYGLDDFEISMNAQYELTKRFTCEYSIRPFIANEQKRTMKFLYKWVKDKDPHVRRLCSEGTRPRLPWSTKIDAFVKDPSPALVILEYLKNDEDLYVRRSVANHLGDIAKDHLDLALQICEKWLENASTELKWVIRHALRNPVKKGNKRALEIRKKAK